jgi:septation ring formation regulator EzrA
MKTLSQTLIDVNRRLESMQQNYSVRDERLIKEVKDTIKIGSLETQIKNEENNKHFAKGLVESIKKIEEKANDTAQQLKNEITFVKRLGFLFAFLLSTILAIKEYIFKGLNG